MLKPAIFFAKTVLVIFTAMLLTSCRHSITFGDGETGNGNIVTQNRTVEGDFETIDVENGIEVRFEQSGERSIAVEVDENLQKFIITKVEDGVLYIFAKESYNTNETPIVFVKNPKINGLESSSGSKISSTKIISESLDARASSGGAIEINVEADAITLESSSGGSISAEGKALKLETTAASGGSVDAERLMSNDVTAQTSSAGTVDVYPILSLKAKASSGGSVGYHKVPKSVTKEESSGGVVSEE